MPGAYATYFDNPFLNLRMTRPEFKAQARYALRAGRQGELDAVFTPLLAALETAIAGFDEALLDSSESTAGATGTYHEARAAWLEFVDDTNKDFVTPKLRKLPVYADFKKYGKSKLAALRQPELLVQSQQLVLLYAAQQAALGQPTLAADAQAALAAVAAADETRDLQDADTDAARLALADDRAAIARAQRRFKAQLELAFENPDKVYSFFDFSKARGNKKVAPAAPKA